MAATKTLARALLAAVLCSCAVLPGRAQFELPISDLTRCPWSDFPSRIDTINSQCCGFKSADGQTVPASSCDDDPRCAALPGLAQSFGFGPEVPCSDYPDETTASILAQFATGVGEFSPAPEFTLTSCPRACHNPDCVDPCEADGIPATCKR
eukprot:SAG22_NODE_233_length_14378_cov_86.382100_7_plen_152_part_00